jgi:gamma-glutamyl hydrolase
MKSYVDWFEEQGVHVLPIPYDTDHCEMYFQMVNGLFIPGTDKGYDIQHKKLVHTVTRFLELSMQPNEYFPIWGTCFGLQLLLRIIGKCTLQRHEANGLFPLRLTPESKRSDMMRSFSKSYLYALEHHPLTLQNHMYGISPHEFMINPHLRRFYRILATAIDEKGKEYVTIVEGKYYPIYGVQNHPERQRQSRPFLSFFLSRLHNNKHTSCSLPWMRSMYTPHKCMMEQKNALCYFF